MQYTSLPMLKQLLNDENPPSNLRIIAYINQLLSTETLFWPKLPHDCRLMAQFLLSCLSFGAHIQPAGQLLVRQDNPNDGALVDG